MRKVLTFVSALLVSLLLPEAVRALTIDVAQVSATIGGESLGIKDITGNIAEVGNGGTYNFDLHDFFPVFGAGMATGFVSQNEGPNFALLEKGLKLQLSTLDACCAPGTQVDISLFIEATWDNPGGLTTQSSSINGKLESNTAFSRVDVTAFQRINPFLDGLPTQDNLPQLWMVFRRRM